MPLCKVVNSDLDTIVLNYVGKHYFLLGSVRCKFTLDDVVEILQIPKGSKELVEVKNYKATSNFEKLFKDKTKVKKMEVEKELRLVLSRGKCEEDDIAVKLWICLLFCTFLIPDSSSAFPSWMLRYIDDLEGLSNYNWALYATEVILDSLDNLKSYCLGCVWALLVCRLLTCSSL